MKVDPPSNRPLTANEVDADPSILRNPGAREKTRNRSGQKGGASKGNFDEPFVRIKYSMKESPAWKVLTLSARRVLDRIEIEFGRHKGRPEANGELIVPYAHFVEYGIGRNEIGPAVRELVALGFVRITRVGVAGNADQCQATQFLITYQPNGSAQYIEDGWKRVKTDEEAEALAKAARARKGNLRAREYGRKGAAARWAKNKIPVMDSIPTPVMDSIPQNAQKGGLDATFPVMDSIPPYRYLPGKGPAAPATVWTVASSYLLPNGHRIEEFALPRHIVRDGWIFQ